MYNTISEQENKSQGEISKTKNLPVSTFLRLNVLQEWGGKFSIILFSPFIISFFPILKLCVTSISVFLLLMMQIICTKKAVIGKREKKWPQLIIGYITLNKIIFSSYPYRLKTSHTNYWSYRKIVKEGEKKEENS